MTGWIRVHKNNRLLAVSSKIDDMPVSPAAFRVYFHLVKLENDGIDSSPERIGVKCMGATYPSETTEQLGERTIKALEELAALKIIRLEVDDTTKTYEFELLSEENWV